MADPSEIADALLARAATLTVGSPALPISMPEVAFDPAADATDGKYVEVQFQPNRPAWEGVSSGRQDQGLLQVTVVWPADRGLIGPLQHVQDVLDHFAKDTVMISGSAKVKVYAEPWAASPLTEASELRIPVTIPWKASA